jgi:hypothetical protein
MKSYALALLATLAVCGCTQPKATDTGSAAFPAPLPAGNVSTTTTTGPNRPTDVGNMAYPAPVAAGNVSTTATTGPRKPTDTGNMAYPTPVPAGTVSTTKP